MLDGRVLGASQVEYKPFGKPPLKRERLQSAESFNTQPGLAGLDSAFQFPSGCSGRWVRLRITLLTGMLSG